MKQLMGIIGIITLFFLASCDRYISTDNDMSNEHQKNGMKVVATNFSKDYKTISVKVKVPDNISFYSLTDSSKFKIETKEHNIQDKTEGNDMQPVLTHVKNIRQQELAAANLRLLILADLTLSESEVAKEKNAIQQMRQWFSPNNLYIAFMSNGGVTSTLPLTDYVMDTYFRKSHSQKLLYRSIMQKLDEVAQWQGLSPEQKGLIVFSDGKIYQKNLPIDPKHYELQAQLLKMNKGAGYSSVEYINMDNAQGDDLMDGEGDGDGGNEAKAILQQLTKHTDGLYFESFNWSKLLANMLETYNIDYADYQFDFVNPNNKEYIGKHTHLSIKIYKGGKLLTSGCAEYKIGNVYDPVIINGMSTVQMVLQGILLAILIGAFVFFILQVIVPYVSYKRFLKKYVTRYTNQNMMVNGIQVSQSCYYCKAPFEEGDEIVVKCKHVMHKSCWDENDYKCPEYGRHCKEGSHYYNAKQPMDRRNAPFYITWVMTSIVAAVVGWLFFLFAIYHFTSPYINDIMLSIHDLQPGSLEAEETYDYFAKHLNVMPLFGLSLNLCLGFGLSWKCEQGMPMKLRLQHAAIKGIASSIMGYLIYILTCIIGIILNMDNDTLIIDWLPWAVNGFGVAYISTFRTRIQLRKELIGISVVVGIIVMFIWANFYLHSMMDNRVQLLICFIIYDVAMAASIAVVAPRSERYFLHVEGATKPMDIALYKWMRTAPTYKVTIGKSVNCNLQMSWDFFSQIAPVQAAIIQEHGRLYLKAIEKGILVEEKPLPIDSLVELYHGKQFTIGKTTFTYIEKDK